MFCSAQQRRERDVLSILGTSGLLQTRLPHQAGVIDEPFEGVLLLGRWVEGNGVFVVFMGHVDLLFKCAWPRASARAMVVVA